MRLPRAPIHTRLLGVVLVFAVAIALLSCVGVNLAFDHSLSRVANDLVTSQARADATAVAAADPQLTHRGCPLLPGQTWVVADGRTLAAPKFDSQPDSLVSQAAANPGVIVASESTDSELFASPVVLDGQQIGAVVAAVSLAPYQHTRREVLLSSIAAALLALVLIGLGAHWLSRAALKPIDSMTANAAAWLETAPAPGFASGRPHDELTRLAATLDDLIDRLQESVARERRLSAEIAHELRNPLTAIVGEAELALRHAHETAALHDAMATIRDSGRQMERAIDSLLASAKSGEPARGHCAAVDAVRECARASVVAAGFYGVDVIVDDALPEIGIGLELDAVVQIIMPVVDNACRYARQAVRLTATVNEQGLAELFVCDDGPGVAAGDEEHIFAPGVRDAGGPNHDGAGLGLTLSRRLARAVGGDVHVKPFDTGARFVVVLPTA